MSKDATPRTEIEPIKMGEAILYPVVYVENPKGYLSYQAYSVLHKLTERYADVEEKLASVEKERDAWKQLAEDAQNWAEDRLDDEWLNRLKALRGGNI